MKTTLIRIFWVLGLAVLLLLPLALLLTTGLFSPAEAQEAKPQYIGAQSCAKVCHKSTKQGKQLGIWREAKHSGAYETLGTDKAKEIAKGKGIADPQKAEACLKCHTTAPGAADELKGAKFSNTEGVGCERCHGPGSLYKKRKIMKDQKASIAKGLLIPDEKTCKECHNEESPTFKPFNFEERLKLIAHMKPKAEG
jgi:hypothetical protein